MIPTLRVVAIVLVAALPGCARVARADPGATTPLASRLAKVDDILREQRLTQHIPGLAFAIVQDDRVVYLKAFGERDLERHAPATPDTLFPIGSCTKAFTAMAVALSQDKGLLSLGDHPRKHLPYFRMSDPEADARVTLRDMLSHQTGLKAYADLAAEPGILTREEYVRAATSAKPAVAFRSAFQYSNAMYSASGEIVGKVNHSTWEQVVDSHIFAPLQMKASTAVARQIVRVPDHATGYDYDSATNTWRPVSVPASLDALAPGGSIASSARDMTQWLRMLTGGGRIGTRRFLSEAAFRDLTTAKIMINSQLSYALGWATYRWKGLAVVEHNGGTRGISALVSFIPERRVGFVLLANTYPNVLTQITNAGKLMWPLILDEDAPAGNAPPTSASNDDTSGAAAPADAAAVDALIARMIAAGGNEEALQRHHALEIEAVKSYENHGVTAALRVRAKAPAMHAEEEIWTAAGRQIARFRMYFDGMMGGQETTFGQDEVNEAAANADARRENDFRYLLNLRRLYSDIRLLAPQRLGDEDVSVLQLTPREGQPVHLQVSAKTALIRRRDVGAQSTTFEDYRSVDGEQIPFLMTIRDALGETTIRIREARFVTDVPDTAFAPQKTAAR